MYTRLNLIGLCLLAGISSYSQNAAINSDGSSPDPSAALDVKSTDKGLLIPRLTAGERTAIALPAKGLMIYQTTAPEGFYYNSGTPAAPTWTYINAPASNNTDWMVGGNTVTATARFGTISNNHIDLVSNNVVRGRLSNVGEFFIGTTNTALAGDLLNSVSNAVFPWAVNGYSGFNGSGVYGAINGASTTAFAGVQGENNSTTGSINSSGVRGSNNSSTAGTGFRTVFATGPRMGVTGMVSGVGSYSFGVHGSSPSASNRTGAIFGDNGGNSMGAVGYFASNNIHYSFYGFGNAFETGSAAGRGPSTPATDYIGLGVYGGVMGGWVRGTVYGAHLKGERYSLYVDGETFTNKPITQLVETENGGRLATYTPAALKTDVTARGRSALEAGSKYIAFAKNFTDIISPNPEEMTITITPTGNSNGVYVSSVDVNGFWVKENNSGNSNVSFNWIAIGTRKGFENPEIAAELLEKDFDEKMNSVMHNEMNTKVEAKPIWWDGSKVRFDAPPVKPVDKNIFTGQRPIPGSKN